MNKKDHYYNTQVEKYMEHLKVRQNILYYTLKIKSKTRAKFYITSERENSHEYSGKKKNDYTG